MTMGDPVLQKINRVEHRVPRWINALWLAFVVSLVLTSVLSVAAWLALYGFSILLEGLEYHKSHCDDSKYWGGMADFIP
jgi:hypothetical protein